METPPVTDILHASVSTTATRRGLDDAPAWARASIDRAREKRGLPALFGREGTSGARGVGDRRGGFRRVLVGVAAAGVSDPGTLFRGRGESLPEIIAPSAWEGVKADLAVGKAFAFQHHHTGKPIVRSDNPNVTIMFDEFAGLMFRIRGQTAAFRCFGGGFASIGFVPRKTTRRMLRGQWVRQIDSMTLRHVALFPPHHSWPVYQAARVRSVAPEQEIQEFVRLRLDTRLAVKEALGL
jgi:hypothetical protein